MKSIFSKSCGKCFRYAEDWRDAESKGFEARHTGLGEMYRKPRSGIKVRAIGVNCPDQEDIRFDHPACEHYEPRWKWNVQTWWKWRLLPWCIEMYRKYIAVPIGARRNPVPLEWQDSFDYMADKFIHNGEAVCPHCGEMPYSYEQCVFCGQRFLPSDDNPDRTVPKRSRRKDEPIIFIDGICPECGGSCGNGGWGPLRCRCGWVGNEQISPELQDAISDLFEDEVLKNE